MGKEKQTVSGAQETKTTPTAEETELNKLYLEREKAAQGGMMSAQQQGLNLVNMLLTGQGLPGYLGQLPGGISPEAIGQQASIMAQKYGPGFQSIGISDSGTAFKETARGISNELLFPAEQFNLQNLTQLLSMALTGQAQVQQPVLAQGGTLSQSLAGLRSTGQYGQQITTSMNPFVKSFQTGLGGALGGMPGRLTYGGGTWGLGIPGG